MTDDDIPATDPRPADPRDIAAAGEYVLGTLPRAERDAFRDRLAAEPRLLAEVARWETHFDPLAEEVQPVSPPARVWRGVSSRLFPEETAAASAAPGVSPLRWLGFGAVCAAVGLLIAIGLGPMLAPERTGPPDLWVSDMVSEDSEVRLTALYDDASGEMRVSMGGRAPSEGRDFELWLIQGDRAPISLGVMPRAGNTAMPVPEDLRALVAGATLAITDEPAGGSPEGVATGPVVAQAELRRI